MSKTPTVVSILNLKGGVGKTTVTALLARFAAKKGLDVLAVDMDPQANLSQALMTEQDYTRFMDKKEPSIVELFNGFAPATKNKPGPSPLQPSNVLKTVDFGGKGKLEVVPSRFDFSDNLIGSINNVDERVLAKFIARHMQGKDLILIDCAPTESILTRTAYHASRYVLIPVKTEFFSTIGFPLMKKSLTSFRQNNRGYTIDICGVIIHTTKTSGSLPSKDGRDSEEDILEQAKKYGWTVFKNKMYHSDSYPRLAKSPYASYPGNTEQEWPPLAREILKKIGF